MTSDQPSGGLPDIQRAALQLNGLVLLHGYLQRVAIYDAVTARLGGTTPIVDGDAELVGAVEALGVITANFDQSAGLTVEQEVIAAGLIEIVRPRVAARLFAAGDGIDELWHQVAVITATFHSDVHISEGLRSVARLYQSDALDEVEARHQELLERAGIASQLVEAVAEVATPGAEPLADDKLGAIGAWYADINHPDLATQDGIDADLEQIAALLAGTPLDLDDATDTAPGDASPDQAPGSAP